MTGPVKTIEEACEVLNRSHYGGNSNWEPIPEGAGDVWGGSNLEHDIFHHDAIFIANALLFRAGVESQSALAAELVEALGFR